jgi:hypothetical protein
MNLELIIKQFLPIISKFIKDIEVDEFIQKVKHFDSVELNKNESVEIFISTESDNKEYVSIVLFNNETKSIVKVLFQQKLNDFIKQMFDAVKKIKK